MTIHSMCVCRRRWLPGALLAVFCSGAHSFAVWRDVQVPSTARIRLCASTGGEDAEAEAPAEEAAVSPAAVTMDDGGSDLTDRFKYKVHALMGTYDPPAGSVDDENQTGNILGGLLQFPTEYTFSVVGKTGDASESDAGDMYAEEVKQALVSVLGSDAPVELRSVPRGTKFTRVTAKVTVESAAIVSTIYETLDTLEATVMKY